MQIQKKTSKLKGPGLIRVDGANHCTTMSPSVIFHYNKYLFLKLIKLASMNPQMSFSTMHSIRIKIKLQLNNNNNKITVRFKEKYNKIIKMYGLNNECYI